MKQLERKFKRSKPFIQMCIDRFGIQKTRFKTTNQLVYDIPKDKMEEIMEFNYARRRKYPARNGKSN